MEHRDRDICGRKEFKEQMYTLFYLFISSNQPSPDCLFGLKIYNYIKNELNFLL